MPGKTVLITGATGAIGSALVLQFLKEDLTEVIFLIRSDSQERLRRRREELLRFLGIRNESPKIRAVLGDVGLADLGLSQTEAEDLKHRVTHLVHAAGNVKLNQTMEQAQRSAVDSARVVADFAQDCYKNGQLVKLEYVSTVGVSGRRSGLVAEQPMQQPVEYRNTYEASKAQAESLILERLKAGLPVTVHRPSMVVGDSVTGRIIHFQVFYHLCHFLSGRFSGGFVPDFGNARLDIIPVDYVVRAIYLSACQPSATGRIFHLCSGPKAPRLCELASRLRQIFTDAGQRLPAVRTLSRKRIEQIVAVLSLMTIGRTRRRLRSLPFFLKYLEDEQMFDNTNTERFFSAAGLLVPDTDQYLPQVMNYYLRSTKESPS